MIQVPICPEPNGKRMMEHFGYDWCLNWIVLITVSRAKAMWN